MGQTVAQSGSLAVFCRAFGCDEALAAAIASQSRRADHDRGTILWPRESDDATSLLLGGVAQEVAYGREGAMLVLQQLEPGDLYGVLAGSDGSDSQIEALSAGEGAHFASATVVRLMESYPAVGIAITRHLSQRLSALRRRMVEAAMLSVTGRIAAELLRRSANAEDRTIRPMPVFSELAVAVQSTRETVSRTVSQMEKRGLLKRVDGGMQIVAAHRLEELVF